jgi:hypothetical protein
MLVVRSLLFCVGIVLAAASVHSASPQHQPNHDGKVGDPIDYIYPHYA